MFVDWGRDHVHTLKAMKFFEADVTSGLDYWLETQEANGMVWDCIAENPNGISPSWFGEALGEGFFRYEEGRRFVVRRIPVEADCEFLYAEGVWQAARGALAIAMGLPVNQEIGIAPLANSFPPESGELDTEQLLAQAREHVVID